MGNLGNEFTVSEKEDRSIDIFTDKEILEYMLNCGTLSVDDVKQIKSTMKKKEIKEMLNNHPYTIYQGAYDGRWYTYVVDDTKKSKRRKIAKATEEQLVQELYKHYKGKSEQKKCETITLNQLYPQWIEYKRLHTTAESYIIRIDTDWKKYYVGTDIIDVPIKKLNKLMLDEWAHMLIKTHNMTKKQYYNSTVIIRQALSYAVDLGMVDSNPMLAVKIDGKRLFRKEKKKSSESEVFTVEERKAVETLAWSDFINRARVYQLTPLALLLQFETGLRISELCVLRYEDIEGDYLHIQRMLRQCTKEVIEHTKNHEDREVVLTSRAKEIISFAKERQQELGVSSDEYIFSINGKPPSDYSIDALYRKYCAQLGIVHKSSHKARKTYISSLIDANVNINTVREMAGHADERTTYKSYCFDRSTETERIELIEKALSTE